MLFRSDRADEAVGNLRESMSRRGLLGSSFGADAEARIRLAFAEEENKALATANVQEIGLKLQTEQARGAAARSLLDVDSRLVTQQAGMIAAQLGLDEFSSQQLTKQLSALRQAHDQALDTIKVDLAELGVAGGITQGLADIATRNAAYNLQAAIANAQAQGKVLSGLTSSGLMVNGAGQLVTSPSVIGRLGGIADRIFGTGTSAGLGAGGASLVPDFSNVFGGDIFGNAASSVFGAGATTPVNAGEFLFNPSGLFGGSSGGLLPGTIGDLGSFGAEGAGELTGLGGIGDAFGGLGDILGGGIGELGGIGSALEGAAGEIGGLFSGGGLGSLGGFLGPAAAIAAPLIIGSLLGGKRNKVEDERRGYQAATDVANAVAGGADTLDALNQYGTANPSKGAVASLNNLVNNALPRILDGMNGKPPLAPPGHPLRAKFEALREEAKVALAAEQRRFHEMTMGRGFGDQGWGR